MELNLTVAIRLLPYFMIRLTKYLVLMKQQNMNQFCLHNRSCYYTDKLNIISISTQIIFVHTKSFWESVQVFFQLIFKALDESR